MVLQALAIIVLAYLIGSLPTAVIIGKTFYKTDVRDFGSKNAGATNTFRVLGYKPGLIVFAIDVLKGLLAVSLIKLAVFSQLVLGLGLEPFYLQMGLGIMAVVGHIFPVFAGFKGGKGVATLLGITLGMAPYAGLTALGIFIVVFLIFGYVSVGSMVAGLCFPILLTTIFAPQPIGLIIFGSIASVGLILTHKKNIVRLLAGTESNLIYKKKV